jgi:hypothetical protein
LRTRLARQASARPPHSPRTPDTPPHIESDGHTSTGLYVGTKEYACVDVALIRGFGNRIIGWKIIAHYPKGDGEKYHIHCDTSQCRAAFRSIQITRTRCSSNPHSRRFGVRYGINCDTHKGHMANLPCRRGAPPSGRTHARPGSATPGCETVKPADFLGQLCAYYALHLTQELPRRI